MSSNSGNDTQNTKGVKSNLYWNTLVRIPAQILNFVISIIVARILMPRDFGILGIVMMLIGYANIFTNFGFNQAIVQKRIIDKKTLDSIFTFDLLISFLIAAGFFFSAGFVAEFFKTPECEKAVRVMSSVFLLTSFSALPHAILRRDMNFKVVSLLEVSQSVMMSIVTLGLAILGWGYWALVYGQLIPLSVITLCYCIKAKWIPSIYFNHSLMKRVYDFGIWSFLSNQFGFVSGHIDKFIVGRYLGAVNLGFYDKSISIGSMPNTSILMQINAVMFSSFSKSKKSLHDLFHYLRKSLTLLSVIILPTYSGLIIIAPYFVYALLGEKWSPMIIPFQIILLGFTFKSFLGLISAFNIGVGKYKAHSLRLLVSVLFFALMAITLVQFGITGIAISFAVFCFIHFVLSTWLAIHHLSSSWMKFGAAVWPALYSSAIMALAVKSLSMLFLQDYTIPNMLILILVGLGVYIILLFMSRAEIIRSLKAEIIRDIRRRILADLL